LTKLLWLLAAALPLHAAAETVEYVHTDALGTPIAVTDASGNLIESSEYEPYGKLLNRPVTDGPGFTGHVQDAATGLTYMQQRYYDPIVGRFLSVDPVTADSVSGANFNRYWYGNNNPYKFTDIDGRLARGSGFTDRQWKRFDRAQQRAAANLEKAAAKITRAIATGEGIKGVARAFERTFGEGAGTTENMEKVASDMNGMAEALRNTGADAIPANGMTTSQIDAAYGGNNADTLAAVPSSRPAQVIVNTAHSDFGSLSKLSWAAGHETAHAVLGYSDAKFNGVKAYKFGSPEQRNTFGNFPSSMRLTNPDHLMDYAQ